MRFIILWGLLFSFQTIFAQHVQNGSDMLFAFEVKQIDEFIERFNNEETLIKDVIRERDPKAVVTRTDILKSLINQTDTSWDLRLINQFITRVSDPAKPIFLNFLDNDWYAELECTVRYLNKDHKMSMFLKVQQEADHSTKWVIVSAKADFLCLPEDPAQSAFLSPASQGTDFMALDKALTDRKSIRNFLPNGYKEDQLSIFLDHWKRGHVLLRQVDKIAYHFLQVDGWIFKVEQYRRKSRNSGWLISSITKAEHAQKDAYKASLHIN